MSATVFYEGSAEIALLGNTFLNSAGSPADPVTVSCVVTDPSGTAVTHTYGGALPADITKTFVGVYALAVPCSPNITGIDGLWSYVWIGTGTVSDIQPGTWRVQALDQTRWYVGEAELKDRIGVTDTSDDSIITAVCASTSRWIDRYCGRHFFRMADTRTYQPHDMWVQPVDDLVSVSQVNIDMDGDGVYETAWTQGVNYRLAVGENQYNTMWPGEPVPYTQLQSVGKGATYFPFIYPFAFLDRVQVVGVFGWPAVPSVVNQAALIIAADWFKMKDAPWGIAGSAELGTVRISPNAWISDQLRPYIRAKGKVGV